MSKGKHKNLPDPAEEPGTLFREARAIAQAETLEALHAATALRISWLRKFRAGEIKNPSVNRIEKILKAFP
jgi:hypothetical protein